MTPSLKRLATASIVGVCAAVLIGTAFFTGGGTANAASATTTASNFAFAPNVLSVNTMSVSYALAAGETATGIPAAPKAPATGSGSRPGTPTTIWTLFALGAVAASFGIAGTALAVSHRK